MISKHELLESIIHECNVCKHLCGKIPLGGNRYKPSSAQRDTTELLRHLAITGIGAVRGMTESSWDFWNDLETRVAGMSASQFPKLMDQQIAEIKAVFAGIDSRDFAHKEAVLPWGTKTTLGRALMETTLKWLVGYRMQLFLYAKAAGNHGLSTPNCWMGVDWKPKDEAKEGAKKSA